MRKLFKNALLVISPEGAEGTGSAEAGVQDGFLSEEGGIIQSVVVSEANTDFERILSREETACDELIDCDGDYLTPGLIDLHCHGALGRDTMEATSEAFDVILDYHATRGTTLAALTTVAASLEELEVVLAAAEEYQKSPDASRFAGIHLEGPYFSPLRRGAHRPEMLRHPTPDESARLLCHAGAIARMTLAPELPGALELIRELVRHGIAASAGHSEASEEEAKAGFEAGMSQVTHLYNCMSSLRSVGGRRMTGLTEAALTNSEILCEVIADGHHLSPTLLRLAWLCKGWKNLVIVSDATAGAGLPEGSRFTLGGLPCGIEERVAWTGEGSERRLAGSIASLIDGVRVMVEQAGIPFEQAVAMATLVPARALGLQEERGSLQIGKRADLLRISAEWQVRGVWSSGISVSKKRFCVGELARGVSSWK